LFASFLNGVYSTWPKLTEKWHRAQALDIAFDKSMPLGQWHNIVQELYEIELSL
jgi:hypothetical protein